MAIRYYIPDWDDRVDPHYDFVYDLHTPGRNPYRDDRYAHEIYGTPPYDGMLLSRAMLDANPGKREAIMAIGSVKAYLRLPPDGEHDIIGDCGAFSYWQANEPPYQTADMLEYYEQLRFDIGVSIDHLIFTEVETEKERRWILTLQNAEAFWQQHQAGGYQFTPMGVAQGWNPASYQEAVRRLIQIGYQHIAIGGLVRSHTNDIIRVLQAVQPELQDGMKVHLFGVNRPEHITTFASLGVTSFDSASRLRRAWIDGRRNYFLGNNAYTAIRIPIAQNLARKKSLDEAHTRQLEQASLHALRAYDRGDMSCDEAYRTAIAYAEVAGHLTERIRQDYRITLQEQPWRQCDCQICQDHGIEVIIFRGNNRNRRRGFHNTWQLYQYLQTLPATSSTPNSVQRTLGL